MGKKYRKARQIAKEPWSLTIFIYAILIVIIILIFTHG